MRIGLFGDVHGRFDIFCSMISHSIEKHNISAAIQIGDFGISKKSLEFARLFDLPIPLHFIDGNHEDFRFLYKALIKGVSDNWALHNLFYQPRGSTILLDGKRTGFIGGALNVDQPQCRKKGNYITNDDINQALLEFSKNPPDVVISHSCPAGIGIGMTGQPSCAWGVANYIIMAGYDPGPSGDFGETQLASLWDNLPVKPQLWVYGHFHQFQLQKVSDTLFLCLPRIDLYRQWVLWDTKTGELILTPEDC